MPDLNKKESEWGEKWKMQIRAFAGIQLGNAFKQGWREGIERITQSDHQSRQKYEDLLATRIESLVNYLTQQVREEERARIVEVLEGMRVAEVGENTIVLNNKQTYNLAIDTAITKFVGLSTE